jgi:hypothetical protein
METAIDPRAQNGVATRWQAGVSGNPNGRPIGTRQTFSNGFLKDLAEVWQAHGKDTMLHTAKTQPATFFAVCARLIPSDVKLTVGQTYGGLDPSDYAILRAIKESLPAANSESPRAVLEFVRDAVLAAVAKTIDCTEKTSEKSSSEDS